MTEMHPDYFKAKKLLNEFCDKYPVMREPENTQFVGWCWDQALEKDESGRQCLHFVKDLIECVSPIKE